MYAAYLRSSPQQQWIWIGMFTSHAEAVDYATWMEYRHRKNGWPASQSLVRDVESMSEVLAVIDDEEAAEPSPVQEQELAAVLS